MTAGGMGVFCGHVGPSHSQRHSISPSGAPQRPASTGNARNGFQSPGHTPSSHIQGHLVKSSPPLMPGPNDAQCMSKVHGSLQHLQMQAASKQCTMPSMSQHLGSTQTMAAPNVSSSTLASYPMHLNSTHHNAEYTICPAGGLSIGTSFSLPVSVPLSSTAWQRQQQEATNMHAGSFIPLGVCAGPGTSRQSAVSTCQGGSLQHPLAINIKSEPISPPHEPQRPAESGACTGFTPSTSTTNCGSSSPNDDENKASGQASLATFGPDETALRRANYSEGPEMALPLKRMRMKDWGN
uniref:myocyte-specific enhancer factor 2C-like isoform X2 n=1 Tax=Myxine glutinosa TaxID=7769 RepID=UPI00358E0A88